MERTTPGPEQLTFLAPHEAEFVMLLRGFVAEAARIYEHHRAQTATDLLTIASPAAAYEFLRPEMAHLEQEQVRVLCLNTKHRILAAPMVYQGTVNACQVRVAEVFRPAIQANAAAIIVAHNHPSGILSPSPEDVHITRQIREAGQILDLELLDHLIVGPHGFTSLRERGFGFS